jgi:hypothetical protein
LLLIEDIRLVKQSCSLATVKFDDDSVADFFDEQVDFGLAPERFGRIWVHTHPGNSPVPSSTDEETFARCFGGADWSVMFILACGGRSYARLRFGVGPGASLMLPLEIDFGRPSPAMDAAAWEQEYQKNVEADDNWAPAKPTSSGGVKSASFKELPTISSDPFFDPTRFDPWECLYERYF